MSVKINAELTQDEFNNLKTLLEDFKRASREQFFRYTKLKFSYAQNPNFGKDDLKEDEKIFVPYFTPDCHQKEIKDKIEEKSNQYQMSESLFKKLIELNKK